MEVPVLLGSVAPVARRGLDDRLGDGDLLRGVNDGDVLSDQLLRTVPADLGEVAVDVAEDPVRVRDHVPDEAVVDQRAKRPGSVEARNCLRDLVARLPISIRHLSPPASRSALACECGTYHCTEIVISRAGAPVDPSGESSATNGG